MKLFTIGHSSLEAERFLEILKNNDIGWVADVRSSPYSGQFPHFNRRALADSLRSHDIKYLFVGDQLGGKPPRVAVDRWIQGKINSELVSRLSDGTKWREGVLYLSRVIKQMTIVKSIGCLVCSEADPSNCHRSLIAFDLEHEMPDIQVHHLRPKGKPGDVRFQKTLFRIRDGEGDYH